MASQWKTFQRFAENLVFNEAPKFIRQLQRPETLPRNIQQGIKLGLDALTGTTDESTHGHHRRTPGDQEQRSRPHSAPAGWCTRRISTAARTPAKWCGRGWSTRTTRRGARIGRCWWWAATVAPCSA